MKVRLLLIYVWRRRVIQRVYMLAVAIAMPRLHDHKLRTISSLIHIRVDNVM